VKAARSKEGRGRGRGKGEGYFDVVSTTRKVKVKREEARVRL